MASIEPNDIRHFKLLMDKSKASRLIPALDQDRLATVAKTEAEANYTNAIGDLTNLTKGLLDEMFINFERLPNGWGPKQQISEQMRGYVTEVQDAWASHAKTESHDLAELLDLAAVLATTTWGKQ